MIMYGVSSKYNFGEWSHRVYGPFETKEQAEKWLNTEERDEYSEEWTKDDDDPIKDYVENAIENVSDKTFSEEGYSWDEGKTIDFFEVIPGDTYHILYRNGEPIELYHVK